MSYENYNHIKNKCISSDDCKSIIGGNYIKEAALLNIGWLISNAILEAGEMIANAIKSNKETK